MNWLVKSDNLWIKQQRISGRKHSSVIMNVIHRYSSLFGECSSLIYFQDHCKSFEENYLVILPCKVNVLFSHFITFYVAPEQWPFRRVVGFQICWIKSCNIILNTFFLGYSRRKFCLVLSLWFAICTYIKLVFRYVK